MEEPSITFERLRTRTGNGSRIFDFLMFPIPKSISITYYSSSRFSIEVSELEEGSNWSLLYVLFRESFPLKRLTSRVVLGESSAESWRSFLESRFIVGYGGDLSDYFPPPPFSYLR